MIPTEKSTRPGSVSAALPKIVTTFGVPWSPYVAVFNAKFSTSALEICPSVKRNHSPQFCRALRQSGLP